MSYNSGAETHQSQSKKGIKIDFDDNNKKDTICDRPRFRTSAEYI